MIVENAQGSKKDRKIANYASLLLNTQGVPFGLGIIQTAGKEDRLIKYGSAIEDLIKGRTEPLFRNVHARNYMYIGVKP